MNDQSSLLVKDAYDHVGQTFRYFLEWRHKIFAGYLAVLATLALAFAWTQPGPTKNGDIAPSPTAGQQLATRALPFIGIVISAVFWTLDFRNRDLFRVCQERGAILERSLPTKTGIYADLLALGDRPAVAGITQSVGIDLLVSAVITALAAQVTSILWSSPPPRAILIGALVLFVVIFVSMKFLGGRAAAARKRQRELHDCIEDARKAAQEARAAAAQARAAANQIPRQSAEE